MSIKLSILVNSPVSEFASSIIRFVIGILTFLKIISLLKESGVQEVVDINGEQTLVSVSKSQWISDPSNPEDLSEMETYHSMLKEFNKLNNLEPVEV